MGSSTPSANLTWDKYGRCFEFYGVLNWKDPVGPDTVWHFDPRVGNSAYVRRRRSLDVPSRPDQLAWLHQHDFLTFVGLPTSFGKTAWVREDYVNGGEDRPRKLACDTCGEQGYEVPFDTPVS